MTTDPEERPRRRPLFDPTVNLGAILQVVTVGAFALAYVVGVRADVTRLTSDVQAVNVRLTEEVGKLSRAIAGLDATLSPFARMMERMDHLERRIAGTEARNEAQEDRLGRLGESVVEIRANLDTLMRASQQNLPGAPGVRR